MSDVLNAAWNCKCLQTATQIDTLIRLIQDSTSVSYPLLLFFDLFYNCCKTQIPKRPRKLILHIRNVFLLQHFLLSRVFWVLSFTKHHKTKSPSQWEERPSKLHQSGIGSKIAKKGLTIWWFIKFGNGIMRFLQKNPFETTPKNWSQFSRNSWFRKSFESSPGNLPWNFVDLVSFWKNVRRIVDSQNEAEVMQFFGHDLKNSLGQQEQPVDIVIKIWQVKTCHNITSQHRAAFRKPLWH